MKVANVPLKMMFGFESGDVCLWHLVDAQCAQLMSAFGGKADIEVKGPYFRF
jgi:hypothetical protein